MEISYELTNESRTVERFGVTVYRIRALRDIPASGVMAGDLGGWIESTHVDGVARIQDDAWVDHNGIVMVRRKLRIGRAFMAMQS